MPVADFKYNQIIASPSDLTSEIVALQPATGVVWSFKRGAIKLTNNNLNDSVFLFRQGISASANNFLITAENGSTRTMAGANGFHTIFFSEAGASGLVRSGSSPVPYSTLGHPFSAISTATPVVMSFTAGSGTYNWGATFAGVVMT